MPHVITEEEFASNFHPPKVKLTGLEQITKYYASVFLRRIEDNNGLWIQNNRKKSESVFSLFEPANSNFFEFKYHEDILEWYLRDSLINPSLRNLLQEQPGIKQIRFVSEEKHAEEFHESTMFTFKYSNKAYEDEYPFEFIIDTAEDQHIGVRYFDMNATPEKVKNINETYNLNYILFLDFKLKSSMPPPKPGQKYSEMIRIHSLSKFFETFLPDENYDQFVSIIRETIQEANKIIGFQTVPDLSLRNVSEYKRTIIRELQSIDFSNLVFQPKPGTNPNLVPILSEDLAIIDREFQSHELFRTLTGTDKAAICFFTSEYLFSIFGEQENFDYTTIVSGYIKSVELILDRIIHSFMQDNPNPNVFITRNRGSYQDKDFAVPTSDLSANKIRLCPQYEKYFEEAAKALIFCLKDHKEFWRVSQKAQIRISRRVEAFIKERNDLFHKDNLSSHTEAMRIRNNALLCLYYLLGSCIISTDPQTTCERLGIVDDSYDRLYKTLATLSDGNKYFWIKFKDQDEIKAVRLLNQGHPQMDIHGYIQSGVTFVLVAAFDEAKDYRSFARNHPKKNEIVISRTNIPESIAYLTSGRKKEIQW